MEFFERKKHPDRYLGSERVHIPLPLFFGLGIYLSLLLSALIHTAVESHTTLESSLLKGEVKDMFMIVAAFWAVTHARDLKSRQFLWKFLMIAAAILIISGFVSLFSIYRLHKIPYHLFAGVEPGPDARLQHHAGTFFTGTALQFHVYMPVGFHNTHLTYAALLGFFLPYFLFQVMHPFILQGRDFLLQWTTLKKHLLPGLILAVSAIVMIFNNGRSAILGMILASLIGVYYLTRIYWGRRILLLLLPALLFAGSFLIVLQVSGQANERFQETVRSLTGEKKHTDYQRALVWSVAWQDFIENPFTGVGPGNFEYAVEKDIIKTGQEKPEMYYPYALIQRGHAHNDLLHLLAIGGVLPGLFYLLFWFSLIREFLKRSRFGSDSLNMRADFFRWGLLLLLGGGIFQCYFQDDEVVLPFWFLAGYFLAGSRADENSE